MLKLFDPFRGLTFGPVVFRVVVAFICASVIGLERSSKNRPAGFRTHVLVCIGAVAASMTGHYIYLVMKLPSDMTRLGAQIITGLGFLGAGTILVTKDHKVKGLTTAAGLWTTGIIGLAIGAGFYEGAILCTALVLVTELILGNMVIGMRKDTELALKLIFSRKDALDQMMRYSKDKNMSIRRLQVHSLEKEDWYQADILLHAPWNVHVQEVMDHIQTIQGIESVHQMET